MVGLPEANYVAFGRTLGVRILGECVRSQPGTTKRTCSTMAATTHMLQQRQSLCRFLRTRDFESPRLEGGHHS